MTALARRIAETPMAPFATLLRGMNRSQKRIVLTFLTESLEEDEATAAAEDNAKLDAALASFSGDWGGKGSAREIAHSIRQGAEMSREVEVW